MKRSKIVLILLLAIFLGAGLHFSYKAYNNWQQLQQRKSDWEALRDILDREVMNFAGETGVVIKDLDMDWEIAHNKDKLIPAASVVKIPIMLACFYAIHQQKINSTDEIELKRSQKTPGSGILKNKPSGSVFTVKELIKLMISNSDNTATNMLIDLLGFDYLNSYFEKIGLENTRLSRKMMDFKRRSQGIENYTNAEDMADVLEGIYHSRLFNSQISQKCLKLLKHQETNNRIPARLPKDTIVAHKTGSERNVCHDIGIVFTDKGDFLICVLTKKRGNKGAREFISRVALFTYNYRHQNVMRVQSTEHRRVQRTEHR